MKDKIKFTTVTISKASHKQLSIFCAQNERTKQVVVEAAIAYYISENQSEG